MYRTSQSINKLGILPIGQIHPFLVLQLQIPHLRAQRRLLLVLVLAVPPYEHHVDQARAPAADDGDFGGRVAGSVLWAEGLWTLLRNELVCTSVMYGWDWIYMAALTDDVTGAVRNQVDGRHCGFLGVSGNVCRDEREQGDKGRGTGLRHVIAGEPASVVR